MRFCYCLFTSRAVVGVLTAASGSVATRQRRMAESRNISCFCCLADRTCAGFLTLFGACSRLCDYPAILISTISRGPFMITGSRNYFFLHIITFRASTGPFTCFATGSRLSLSPLPSMIFFAIYTILRAIWCCAYMPMACIIFATPCSITIMHMLCGLRRCLLLTPRPRCHIIRCHCRWHHGADHGKGQEQ